MDLASMLPQIHRLSLQGERCFCQVVYELFVVCKVEAANGIKQLIQISKKKKLAKAVRK